MYVYVSIFAGFILPLLSHYCCSLIEWNDCPWTLCIHQAAKQEETYGTSVAAAQFWGLLENYVTRLVIAVDNFVTPNL